MVGKGEFIYSAALSFLFVMWFIDLIGSKWRDEAIPTLQLYINIFI